MRLNDAQLAAIELYGPFNDGESEQWVAIHHIWEDQA